MAKPSQEFLDGMAVLKLCGHVDKIDYLEAFWRMNEKYPWRGWDDEGKKLEAFYEKLKEDKPQKDISRLLSSILPDLSEKE